MFSQCNCALGLGIQVVGSSPAAAQLIRWVFRRNFARAHSVRGRGLRVGGKPGVLRGLLYRTCEACSAETHDWNALIARARDVPSKGGDNVRDKHLI